MNEETESAARRDSPAPQRKPLVSLVVPAFNEEASLERNLARLASYLESLEPEYGAEIVVVDDGSSDRTGEVADAFASSHANVSVIHHGLNFRLGQALRSGFRETRGDIVVVLDADLSYAPETVGALLRRMKETRAKIVIASPYRRGGRVSGVPLLRRVLSRWANRFLCLMASKDFFSDRLTNITGMVRAYDGDFIRGLSLWSMDVDINPEIINKAKILRARIVEIPAHLDWGAAGPSSRRNRPGGFHLSKTVIQSLVSGFMFRPFLFFIAPGLILFALSLYPLAWTVIHTIGAFTRMAAAGQSFDSRLSEAVGAAFKLAPHAFIVGGVTLLVAIQLISLGLLALQKKRYFVELFYLESRIYGNNPGGERSRIFGDPLRKG